MASRTRIKGGPSGASKPGRRRARGSEQLTIDGKTLAVATWAHRFGLAAAMVRRRLARGYSGRAALFVPSGTGRMHGIRILAVGEDPHVLAALGTANVTVVRDLAGARRWLGEGPKPGETEAVIVATEELPAREAARIVAAIGWERAIALYGTGPLPAALEREARGRGDRCWCMESAEDLPRFLRFAAAVDRCGDATVALAVADLATRGEVKPNLTQIIALSATDASSEDICQALRVGPNTLKTHVRHLLQATKEPNLDRLGKRVLRMAMARAHEHLLDTPASR